MSYSDLFQIVHEREYEEEITAGDIVRTGPNLFPHYTVVAVSDDMAWVRNIETGAQALTPINRCRLIHEQREVRAA